MKPEQLKLYNKYYDVNKPNEELIYIGIDRRDGMYIFLYKTLNDFISNNFFKNYFDQWGLNYEEINKLFNINNYRV